MKLDTETDDIEGTRECTCVGRTDGNEGETGKVVSALDFANPVIFDLILMGCNTSIEGKKMEEFFGEGVGDGSLKSPRVCEVLSDEDENCRCNEKLPLLCRSWLDH